MALSPPAMSTVLILSSLIMASTLSGKESLRVKRMGATFFPDRGVQDRASGKSSPEAMMALSTPSTRPDTRFARRAEVSYRSLPPIRSAYLGLFRRMEQFNVFARRLAVRASGYSSLRATMTYLD